MVRKKPSTIAEAKEAKSKTFYGKGNKELAAVTKEELQKSGLSLRDYLNKQQGKTRRTAKVTPKSKSRPAPTPKAKREIPTPVKASSNADLSAPEIPKSKSKNDPTRNIADDENRKSKDILGTREQSRARRRARQEAKTKKDTSMTPEQKLSGQIGIGVAAAALIAPVALPILMKVATKHGPAFARSLGNKIKNLTSRQQKNVVQEANRAPTKTAAQKRTSEIITSGGRTQSSRKPLKRDNISEASRDAKNTRPTPRTAAQKRSDAMSDAAKQSQRREIDPGYTGGALKKGGQIKKYNKGGKVYKRKEGGQVMSGNDLVSSIYN